MMILSQTIKTAFLSKIQSIIVAIENSKLKSDDDKWLDFEQQVMTAKQFATEPEEKENRLGKYWLRFWLRISLSTLTLQTSMK